MLSKSKSRRVSLLFYSILLLLITIINTIRSGSCMVQAAASRHSLLFVSGFLRRSLGHQHHHQELLIAARCPGRMSMSMSSSSSSSPLSPRPKVIVVTGPTAVGKSSLALKLCREKGGEIISVDSVQVYRHLDIGSNKPSPEERAEVPHHLLDVLDVNAPEAFTAGDFVRKAEEAIDDVLARGRLPVVVGGTSMYTQWLVQGRPDAPKSDPKMELHARSLLAPFQAKNDWGGGLALLAEKHAARAAKIMANDWYRLERALEVSIMTSEDSGPAFTGVRAQPLVDKYDFRCFFLIAPREPLCHVIDQRCLQMVEKGLLEETADLLSSGVLNPASPPGRAIGYRQAIDFLTKDVVTDAAEEEKALKLFLEEFATATRRYAKQQMVWYRAQREFVWVPWDLQDMSGALAHVQECVADEETAHQARRQGEEQEARREENLKEGKKMKTYTSQVLAGLTGDRLSTLVQRARECRAKMEVAKGEAGK